MAQETVDLASELARSRDIEAKDLVIAMDPDNPEDVAADPVSKFFEDHQRTIQEVIDGINTILGSTAWQTGGTSTGGGLATAQQIIDALDAHFGNEDWRTQADISAIVAKLALYPDNIEDLKAPDTAPYIISDDYAHIDYVSSLPAANLPEGQLRWQISLGAEFVTLEIHFHSANPAARSYGTQDALDLTINIVDPADDSDYLRGTIHSVTQVQGNIYRFELDNHRTFFAANNATTRIHLGSRITRDLNNAIETLQKIINDGDIITVVDVANQNDIDAVNTSTGKVFLRATADIRPFKANDLIYFDDRPDIQEFIIFFRPPSGLPEEEKEKLDRYPNNPFDIRSPDSGPFQSLHTFTNIAYSNSAINTLNPGEFRVSGIAGANNQATIDLHIPFSDEDLVTYLLLNAPGLNFDIQKSTGGPVITGLISNVHQTNLGLFTITITGAVAGAVNVGDECIAIVGSKLRRDIASLGTMIGKETQAREASHTILSNLIIDLGDSDVPFLFVAPYYWERSEDARSFVITINGLKSLNSAEGSAYEDTDKIRVLINGQNAIDSMGWTLVDGARLLNVAVDATVASSVDSNISDPNDPVNVDVEFYATGGSAISRDAFKTSLRAQIPVVTAEESTGGTGASAVEQEISNAGGSVVLQAGVKYLIGEVAETPSGRSVIGSAINNPFFIDVESLTAAAKIFVLDSQNPSQAAQDNVMGLSLAFNSTTRSLTYSAYGTGVSIVNIKGIGTAPSSDTPAPAGKSRFVREMATVRFLSGQYFFDPVTMPEGTHTVRFVHDDGTNYRSADIPLDTFPDSVTRTAADFGPFDSETINYNKTTRVINVSGFPSTRIGTKMYAIGEA